MSLQFASGTNKRVPTVALVEFSDQEYTGPRLRYAGRDVVPIPTITEHWVTTGGPCTRQQLPLMPCWAIIECIWYVSCYG